MLLFQFLKWRHWLRAIICEKLPRSLRPKLNLECHVRQLRRNLLPTWIDDDHSVVPGRLKPVSENHINVSIAERIANNIKPLHEIDVRPEEVQDSLRQSLRIAFVKFLGPRQKRALQELLLS